MEELTNKDVDALLEVSTQKVLDNATLAAILRNINGRLNKLETNREPKAKASKEP